MALFVIAPMILLRDLSRRLVFFFLRPFGVRPRAKPNPEHTRIGNHPTNDSSRAKSGGSQQSSRQERHSNEEKCRPPLREPAFDPYSILGVTRDTTYDEIQRSYGEKVKQYHPNRVRHLGIEFQELATEKMKQIQRAFDMLMAN